jgi:hypothetical protein
MVTSYRKYTRALTFVNLFLFFLVLTIPHLTSDFI